jgi:CheY-like chemotaxis protein
MDIMMPEDDGIRVIKHIQDNCGSYSPHIYVITGMNTHTIYNILDEIGIKHITAKPYNAEQVYYALNRMLSEPAMPKAAASIRDVKKDVSDEIDSVLIEIGIPTRFTGFIYVKTALFFMLDNPLDKGAMYNIVSDICNSSYTRVERSIRHAKETCMKSDNILYKSLFGNSKVSNLEFVNRLALCVERRIRGK